MAKEYLDKLKNPKWQKKRLRVLDRDKWTCVLCEDTETTLHIHHNSYIGDPWEIADEELETLCEHCHLLKEYYKKNYNYPVSILKIRKKASLCCEQILYVYRMLNNSKVIDIFSIVRREKNNIINLEVVFSENGTDDFIDFVNSLKETNG